MAINWVILCISCSSLSVGTRRGIILYEKGNFNLTDGRKWMRRQRTVKTYHGDSQELHQHRTECKRRTLAHVEPQLQRGRFARMADEHHYHDILRTICGNDEQQQGPQFVIVESTSSLPLRRKQNFRCYVGDSQRDAMRTMAAPLTCQYHPTRNGWRGHVRWKGQDVGITMRDGPDQVFIVNGKALLQLRVHTEYDTPSRYRLKLGSELFDHAPPVWNTHREQYVLKYHLLKTSRVGVASCKNFSMVSSTTGKTAIECLRISSRQMLVAVQAPFNVLAGAVVGIARFRS